MPAYVDGFLIPVPKKNLAAYRGIAQRAGKLWREHGALEYRECVGDDLKGSFGLPFPKLMKLKPNETAVFSWIVYRSKAHRDAVNKKIMKDPRMIQMMKEMETRSPFDGNRMSYGGFKVLVDA